MANASANACWITSINKGVLNMKNPRQYPNEVWKEALSECAEFTVIEKTFFSGAPTRGNA